MRWMVSNASGERFGKSQSNIGLKKCCECSDECESLEPVKIKAIHKIGSSQYFKKNRSLSTENFRVSRCRFQELNRLKLEIPPHIWQRKASDEKDILAFCPSASCDGEIAGAIGFDCAHSFSRRRQNFC